MNRVAYIVLFLCSVLISSISQMLLKRAANKIHKNKLAEYMNPIVVIAYFLFFGATLLTVFAYRGVPLTLGPILESTGYIFVAILSVVILKEKVTRRKVFGNILIVLGVSISTFF